MAEEHLGLSDESTVNPFFGGGTTGLADDSAKVTFGETHTIGVVANLVLLAASSEYIFVFSYSLCFYFLLQRYDIYRKHHYP